MKILGLIHDSSNIVVTDDIYTLVSLSKRQSHKRSPISETQSGLDKSVL